MPENLRTSPSSGQGTSHSLFRHLNRDGATAIARHAARRRRADFFGRRIQRVRMQNTPQRQREIAVVAGDPCEFSATGRGAGATSPSPGRWRHRGAAGRRSPARPAPPRQGPKTALRLGPRQPPLTTERVELGTLRIGQIHDGARGQGGGCRRPASPGRCRCPHPVIADAEDAQGIGDQQQALKLVLLDGREAEALAGGGDDPQHRSHTGWSSTPA